MQFFYQLAFRLMPELMMELIVIIPSYVFILLILKKKIQELLSSSKLLNLESESKKS